MIVALEISLDCSFGMRSFSTICARPMSTGCRLRLAKAVTLMSAEPRTTHASVAQRPGSRHSIDDGAPGRVIRSQLDAASYPPARFEVSRDEVVSGLSSVAVPLPVERAAALAVVYLTQPVDEADVAAQLASAATRILAAAR